MKVGLSITASLSRSAERDQQQNRARRLIFLSPKRKGATTAPAALHPRRGCQPDRVGGCRGSMSGYAAFSLMVSTLLTPNLVTLRVRATNVDTRASINPRSAGCGVINFRVLMNIGLHHLMSSNKSLAITKK